MSSVIINYFFNKKYASYTKQRRPQMTVSEKQQKRRKEIAMAVREIMQKTNFNNITVDDICNATGIAKGTFYHYFSSKDAY